MNRSSYHVTAQNAYIRLMTVCSWCKAVIDPGDVNAPKSNISHGICEACAKGLRAELPMLGPAGPGGE